MTLRRSFPPTDDTDPPWAEHSGLPGDLPSRRGVRGCLVQVRQRTLAHAARLPARMSRWWDRTDDEGATSSLVILMYHRVWDEIPGVDTPTMNVPPAAFERQLRGLLARGFRPTRLADCLAAAEASAPLPGRRFVVTFDDGYVNTVSVAGPILKRLGIPATVFLATGFLDSSEPFPFDDWHAAGDPTIPSEAWRPLRVAEIADATDTLADGPVLSFAGHTHTHADFRGRPEAFRADLALSRTFLRERLGVTDPIPFAFPYGAERLGFCTPAMQAITREAGFRCGLTTTARPVRWTDSPFGWPRVEARSFDTASTLAAKATGWFSLLDRWCRP